MMTVNKAHQRYFSPKRRFFATTNPDWFFFKQRVKLIRRTLKHLRKGDEVRRYLGKSHEIYEDYSDFEMRLFENGSRWTLDHGRMAQVTFRRIREYYLEPIISEINKLAAQNPDRPVQVLEVGCGNGTNLMLLAKIFGKKVKLSGIDVSKSRLELGREYWKGGLDNVDLATDSALTLSTKADNSVDLVFSIHCLEQIPYSVDSCLNAMSRVTRNLVVFVEPTWEFANSVQKLYTLLGDQLRTLIPDLRRSDLDILSHTKAEILANPLNQTGFIVARKKPM